MAKIRQLSTKRALIDKTSKNIVIVTAVAAFVVVFCLMASKTLLSQVAYQNRVIDAKKTALDQLKTDDQAAQNLATSFQAFTNTPQNLIGGSPTDSGAQDGDNAKIVLDALPSKYDFPATINSVQSLIDRQDLKIQSIEGTDDQSSNAGNDSSTNPQAVAIPFSATVDGSYDAVRGLVGDFQNSIRPFAMQKLELSGSESKMTLTVNAQTYYQPGIDFKVTTKTID